MRNCELGNISFYFFKIPVQNQETWMKMAKELKSQLFWIWIWHSSTSYLLFRVSELDVDLLGDLVLLGDQHARHFFNITEVQGLKAKKKQ